MAARLRTLALVLALVSSLAAPLALDAQPQLAAKKWRIGFLSLVSGDLEQYKPWLAAFRTGLRQLGYVEGDNVDVLVTAPAGSALAARKVTSTIPIVADAHADLVPKRLALLKQVAPSMSRVGVLWNPSNASTAPQVKTIETSAPALGLHVVPIGVKGPQRDDVDRAFVTIGKDRVDGLLVLGDSTLRARVWLTRS